MDLCNLPRMSKLKGSIGTSMGGATEESPQRRERIKGAMKRQEKRWAAKAGPLKTRVASPEEIEEMLKRKK